MSLYTYENEGERKLDSYVLKLLRNLMKASDKQYDYSPDSPDLLFFSILFAMR